MLANAPKYVCNLCNTEYDTSEAQVICTELCVKLMPLWNTMNSKYCSKQNEVIDDLYKTIQEFCSKYDIPTNVLVLNKHTYGIAVTIMEIPKEGIILWDHILRLLTTYGMTVNKSSFIMNITIADIVNNLLKEYISA